MKKTKRTKTTRACDQCRTARSRCEDPPAVTSAASSDKCRRCAKHGKDCTFVLSVGDTRGRVSNSLAEQTENLSPTDFVAIFRSVFLPDCPIISKVDFSSTAHSTHILLTCCMRYMGALLVGAPEDTVAEIGGSIRSYLLTKAPFTRPLPQNVQAFALMALRIESPSARMLLTTAIRMACALGWHRSVVPPSPTAPLAMTDYLWWTLSCEDIWLYVFTGVPNMIYERDCKVRSPTAPTFLCAVVELSAIVRHLLRQDTADGRHVPSGGVPDLLAQWESAYGAVIVDKLSPLPEISPPSTSSSQYPSDADTPESVMTMSTTLTSNAIMGLLYGAVIGLLLLDTANSHPRDARQLVNAQRVSALYFALQLERRYRDGAFARWRALVKLADICGAALLVLGDAAGAEWTMARGSNAGRVRGLQGLWDYWQEGDRLSAAEELSAPMYFARTQTSSQPGITLAATTRAT